MKKLAPRKNQWGQRRETKAAKGIIGLLLFYVFGSLAIDSGSYWHYSAAVLFGGFGVWFIVRAIRNK